MSNGSGRTSHECTHAPVVDERPGGEAKLRRRSEPFFYSAWGPIASSDADLRPMSGACHVLHALRRHWIIVASMVGWYVVGFVLRDFGGARGVRWVRSRDFWGVLGGAWVRSRDFGPKLGGDRQCRTSAIIQRDRCGWLRSRKICADLETRSVSCPDADCEEIVKNGFVRRIPGVRSLESSLDVVILA
jgi:hypothetical protein